MRLLLGSALAFAGLMTGSVLASGTTIGDAGGVVVQDYFGNDFMMCSSAPAYEVHEGMVDVDDWRASADEVADEFVQAMRAGANEPFNSLDPTGAGLNALLADEFAPGRSFALPEHSVRINDDGLEVHFFDLEDTSDPNFLDARVTIVELEPGRFYFSQALICQSALIRDSALVRDATKQLQEGDQR